MSALRTLLSDRYRTRVALVLVIFLVVSGIYWIWLMTTLRLGDWHAVVYPTEHPGEQVVLSLWSVKEVDGASRYHLAKFPYSAVMDGPTADLTVGDSVSVGAQIQADGRLAEMWREAHPDRAAKALAGYGSLGFLVLFLPLAFRVRGGRVVPRG